jgi:hypothetical protein
MRTVLGRATPKREDILWPRQAKWIFAVLDYRKRFTRARCCYLFQQGQEEHDEEIGYPRLAVDE